MLGLNSVCKFSNRSFLGSGLTALDDPLCSLATQAISPLRMVMNKQREEFGHTIKSLNSRPSHIANEEALWIGIGMHQSWPTGHLLLQFDCR